MMRFLPVFVALPMLFSGMVSCKQSTSGGNSVERNREEAVVVNEELNYRMAAYLMVYFKDDDHSLHFALSKDGRSFTDINKGKAVIAGDTIAEQKGIRDPHIYRGQEGNFYLAMTDLHIFAKRDGIRETEWQRDGEKYGWGNNRGFVLMKSSDLINWSNANGE